MTDRQGDQNQTGVIVCPSCGFSHLRGSRARSLLERARTWWTATSFFRCQTCQWRGTLRDQWSAARAFPLVRPLALKRELDIEPLEERDEQASVELLLQHKAEVGQTLRIWLDDARPAPEGWLHLRSVGAVKPLISAGLVRELSLDHDLGWCADCIRVGAHLRKSGKRHCPHTETGYDLCRWMAQAGIWPAVPPTVHSGNLDGGARMRGLVARHWSDPAAPSPAPRPRSPAEVAHPADLTAMAQLTRCPACGARRVTRAPRASNIARVRTLLTRRYPRHCQACGWSGWVREPILVRLSSSSETPVDELTPRQFDAIDPDK